MILKIGFNFLILQYEFGNLTGFETMRPLLEDIVQTLIDQFQFLFSGQEEVLIQGQLTLDNFR